MVRFDKRGAIEISKLAKYILLAVAISVMIFIAAVVIPNIFPKT